MSRSRRITQLHLFIFRDQQSMEFSEEGLLLQDLCAGTLCAKAPRASTNSTI